MLVSSLAPDARKKNPITVSVEKLISIYHVSRRFSPRGANLSVNRTASSPDHSDRQMSQASQRSFTSPLRSTGEQSTRFVDHTALS